MMRMRAKSVATIGPLRTVGLSDRVARFAGGIAFSLIAAAVPAAPPPPAVVPDAKFHKGATGVFFSDETTAIISDYGRVRGRNAFYSFSKFDVPPGGVIISESAPVQNLIVRVRGGNVSTISGTLSATSGAPQPNLFLMNPAGFVFGAGGQVSVNGHLVVTTADSIRLSGGEVFTARSRRNEVLGTTDPASFGFLAARRPGRIVVRGAQGGANTTLEAGSARVLALIAGGVTVDTANLNAGFGRVSLVAVGDRPREVDVARVTDLAAAPRLNGRTDSAAADGNVSLAGSAVVSAQDGSVVVRAKSLSVVDSAAIVVPSASVPGAVDVDVRRSLTLAGDPGNPPAIDGSPLAGGAATAGAAGARIELTARAITLDGRTIVDGGVDAFAGGLVRLRGRRSIDIRNLALVDVSTAGSAPAGRIEVLDSGALTITGVGRGQGDLLTGLSAGSSPPGDLHHRAGAAGSISIDVDALTLKFAGSISTNSFAAGAGGSVEVHAGDVLIDGFGGPGRGVESRSPFLTGIEARAERDASRDTVGGTITVNAGRLALVNGGVISASTFGRGAGGNVDVTARQGLRILAAPDADQQGGSPFTGILARSDPQRGRPTGGSSHAKLGPAGTVTVLVTDGDLTVIGRGARISTRATDPGVQAGDVTVAVAGRITLRDDGADRQSIEASTDLRRAVAAAPAPDESLTDQGAISALSTAGGVQVTLTAGGPVTLLNATINAKAATSGLAKVSVDAPVVSLNDSFINALTTDDERNIRVSISGPVLRSAESDILTNQRDFTFDLDIAGAIAALDARPTRPDAVLRDVCRIRLGGMRRLGSFVVTGRGALPAEPGGLIGDFRLDSAPRP
jgi:filamentous hemagglutinin family protein